MTNLITRPFANEGTFTITVAALADGGGRCSDSEANADNYFAAEISVKLTSHATNAPDDGSVCTVYLLKDVGALASDGWAGIDAAFTPLNSYILGVVGFTDDANTAFYGVFNTERFGAVGPNIGIAIVNSTGEALHVTAGNHECHFRFYTPQIQDTV